MKWGVITQAVKQVVVPVVLWRLAILAVMAVAWQVLPSQPSNIKPYLPELESYNNRLLQGTATWDGIWYGRIIREGYGTPAPELKPQTAFFPLFPYTVKGVSETLGINTLWAVFWVNLLAVIGGAYFLTRIAEAVLPAKKASRALWLWLSFPTAFFMAAMYTEAIFCFLTFGAFWYAIKSGKKSWLWALPFVALLGMTKVAGILIGGAIALAWLTDRQWAKGITMGVASLVGLGVTMLVQQQAVGDPLAFLHIHDTYFTQEKLNFNVLETFQTWWNFFAAAVEGGNFHQTVRHGAVFVGFFGAVALTVIGAVKKLPLSFTLFSALTLALFLLTNSRNSMVRYILPLFPMYLTLAMIQSKAVNRGWIIAGSILMGLFAALFAAFYVVA